MTPHFQPFDHHTLRSAADRVQRAITKLLNEKIFFGALTIHMMPAIPDPERETIATDGRNLRYNPHWINQATADQIVYAIARIALAAGLAHHIRRGDRSYPRWQTASQLVTIPMMKQHGFLVESDGLDMAIEQAYELVQEPDSEQGSPASQPDQGQQTDQPSPQGASGNGDPDNSRQAVDASQMGEIMDSPMTKEGTDQTDQNHGSQQSDGQNISQSDGRSSGSDQQSPGQQARQSAISPQEQTQRNLKDEQTRWRTRLKQAVQIAKTQGNNTDYMEEFIHVEENPSIDWIHTIQPFMRDSLPVNITYNIPDRRFAATGPYLPGKKSRHIDHICFAIDSSASMNTDELAMIWSEIRAAALTIEPTHIRIIQCDLLVREDQTYDLHELPDKLSAKGRGGTRFSPVFDRIDEDDTPACLIYMTDLQCSDYPTQPPDYPVLWICTDPHHAITPPFGERIDISVD